MYSEAHDWYDPLLHHVKGPQPGAYLDLLICIKVNACSREAAQSAVTSHPSGQPGADQQAGLEACFGNHSAPAVLLTRHTEEPAARVMAVHAKDNGPTPYHISPKTSPSEPMFEKTACSSFWRCSSSLNTSVQSFTSPQPAPAQNALTRYRARRCVTSMSSAYVYVSVSALSVGQHRTSCPCI